MAGQDPVIWLDLSLPVLVWRFLRRTWRRWRSREVIWGTNYERFWPHFMIWRPHDSLLGWIITQHARKRRDMIAYMSDPRWEHIRFVRLRSSREVEGLWGSWRTAARPRIDCPAISEPYVQRLDPPAVFTEESAAPATGPTRSHPQPRRSPASGRPAPSSGRGEWRSRGTSIRARGRRGRSPPASAAG